MDKYMIFGLLLLAGLVASFFWMRDHGSALFMEQYPVADYGKLQRGWWH